MQVDGVLDPLVGNCRGQPIETIRPLVAQAWRREFGSALSEPGLSDTAAALREGRPWSEALWTDGW